MDTLILGLFLGFIFGSLFTLVILNKQIHGMVKDVKLLTKTAKALINDMQKKEK